MSKTVTQTTSQLVTYHSTAPVDVVIARLEEHIGQLSSTDILARLRTATTQAELQAIVDSTTGGSGFLYFNEIPHHVLIQHYHGGKKQPKNILYTFGNPLLAQKIINLNPFAASAIPPRVLVTEKADGAGTCVSYHLPSSVIGNPAGKISPELQLLLDELDGKVEALVRTIISDNSRL